jgi:hypothetical protein
MNLKEFGVEGPLGFPMPDKQARMLDTLLKAQPKGKEYDYRRAVKAGTSEVNPGERSDVSWISTESVDRTGEVVIAKGMNDSQFAVNPIVTLNHCYWQPAIGRSLWRKRVKDGDMQGIKAKTQYPPAPASWPEGETWPSDKVFGLVQSGLLNGKSIGFLPLKVHFPDPKEASKNGYPADCLVIDEWLLLEYAACLMPCNQDALTEVVSKAGPVPPWLAKAMGWENVPTPTPQAEMKEAAVAFTTMAEIERMIKAGIAGINFEQKIDNAVSLALDRARGRV